MVDTSKLYLIISSPKKVRFSNLRYYKSLCFFPLFVQVCHFFRYICETLRSIRYFSGIMYLISKSMLLFGICTIGRLGHTETRINIFSRIVKKRVAVLAPALGLIQCVIGTLIELSVKMIYLYNPTNISCATIPIAVSMTSL